MERLGLSFKTTAKLNKMIDYGLPGCPQFEHHEVLVGNEVCKIFLQDVLECVHALFGDPYFTPYLAVASEKHFMDLTMSTQMYHDMHTGHWWWATQVKLLFVLVGPIMSLRSFVEGCQM